MDEQDIRLENGELLSVKVNFLTLYLIKKTGIDKLQKKLKTAKKEAIEDLNIEIAAKMIYVILRSNGKKVDEEEAMMLVPIDAGEIGKLFIEFKNKMEKLKKKEDMKM